MTPFECCPWNARNGWREVSERQGSWTLREAGLRYTGTSTHGFIAISYEPQFSRASCLPAPSHGIEVGIIIPAHAKFRCVRVGEVA